MNLLQGSSLAVVFVVAADLELEPVALVAAFRRPVEDRVVAHQERDPAARVRIGVVDGAVVESEDAEAEALGQVPDDVGAGLPRVTGGDRWQLLEHRLGPLPRLLLAAGEAEVGVELTAGRRHPGEAPAHPLLERLHRRGQLPTVPVFRPCDWSFPCFSFFLWSQQPGQASVPMRCHIGGVSPGTDEGARTIQIPSPTIISASGVSMAAFTGSSF